MTVASRTGRPPLNEDDEAFYQKPQAVISARRQPKQPTYRDTQSGGAYTLRTNAPKNHTHRKTADDTQITRIPADVKEYDNYEVEMGDVARKTTTQSHQDPVTRPVRSIRRTSWWRRQHPAMHVGIILLSLLLLLSIGANIFSWFVNTWSDPLSYTQTAHKEIVSLRINGHQDEVHAFLDQSEHLDLLVIPDGDISKAHLIAGPQLYLNAQQVVLTTTHQGSLLTVEAHTQREAGIFFSVQPSANWSVDLAAGGEKK